MEIFKNWNVVQMDGLKLTRAEAIHSTQEKIQITRCFSFQFLLSIYMERKNLKKRKFSLYARLVFSLKVRQLIVWFFNRGLGKTWTWQPIGTSLRKVADTVKFVNL